MNSILLATDALAKKLERLKVLAMNGEYFLAEHFYSIRNDVDIECEERLLQLESPGDVSTALRLNEQRTALIELINAGEQQCLLRYSLNRSKLNLELSAQLASISERLDKARSTHMSETFAQRLEEELDQAINDFLSSIFSNRTLIYKRQQLSNRVELGKLLIVDEYLNRNEIELVK